MGELSTVGQLRDGLKTRLSTIPGLTAHADWPDIVNPPAAVVKPAPDRTEYQQTFGGGLGRYGFDVILAVTMAGGVKNAQDLLDPYISASGASSVFAAIHGDRTLGGVAAWTNANSFSEYDSAEMGEQTFLTATAEVEVWST